MSEWSIEHAWKLTPAARVDAHQNPPTHHRSISSRYNEVLRDTPVSDDVHPGFRGVCDTVLTQKLNALRTMRVAVRPYASLIASWPSVSSRRTGQSLRCDGGGVLVRRARTETAPMGMSG